MIVNLLDTLYHHSLRVLSGLQLINLRRVCTLQALQLHQVVAKELCMRIELFSFLGLLQFLQFSLFAVPIEGKMRDVMY